jgi:signal transduction histidine kinase
MTTHFEATAPERLGLRQFITVVAVVIAALAALLSTSLVVLTTQQHEANGALRETVRDVHVAQQVESTLRAHGRPRDPTPSAEVERALRGILAEMSVEPPRSAELRAAQEAATTDVQQYLAVSHRPDATIAERDAAHEAAIDALERVVQADIRDADRIRASSAVLDDLGDVIGGSAAVLTLAALAMLGLWMRRAVIRPVLSLSEAMDRFAHGELSVRARPTGAPELRRMTEAFNAMAAKLERQHDARLTHLAGVAHDLRNPLAALQMSSVLLDPEQHASPSSARRASAVVRRQVARLTRMVEDLLDATRIETGQLTLELQDTDLRALTQDVAQLFEETSPLHRITYDVSTEPLVVRCDPMRIEQTLTNLVSNAIKYSPRGGAVRLVARREDGAATISVSDEGSGIAPSELEHIWEPFRRTGVSNESIPGVGLGLWIARQIVEAHRGTLTVASTLGKGSTFTLSVPLTVEPARERVSTTVPVGLGLSPAGSRGHG